MSPPRRDGLYCPDFSISDLVIRGLALRACRARSSCRTCRAFGASRSRGSLAACVAVRASPTVGSLNTGRTVCTGSAGFAIGPCGAGFSVCSGRSGNSGTADRTSNCHDRKCNYNEQQAFHDELLLRPKVRAIERPLHNERDCRYKLTWHSVFIKIQGKFNSFP